MWKRKPHVEDDPTPKDLALIKNEKSIRDSINELVTGIEELREISKGKNGHTRPA